MLSQQLVSHLFVFVTRDAIERQAGTAGRLGGVAFDVELFEQADGLLQQRAIQVEQV